MTLDKVYDRLNFWINKYTGSFYTIEELTDLVDNGQLSLYADLQPQYATSQRIKDALSPFRSSLDFNNASTVGGLITIPANLNCLNITDLFVTYTSGARTIYVPVALVNEDERTNALRSQIDEPTVTSPVAEQINSTQIQLWPKVPNNGTVSFLRRPVRPVYNYTVTGGRVIVYNPIGSTQLEWKDNWINALLLKALSSIGINLTDQEVMGWAEQKTAQNAQNINRT